MLSLYQYSKSFQVLILMVCIVSETKKDGDILKHVILVIPA